MPLERELLVQGAQQLGCALSERQCDQLLAYQALLLKWNQVYNLTAVREPASMLTHHLLDSLSVVPPLMKHIAGKAQRLLDVGSGAGLPGVVIAALMPELDVSCVDTVGKKASFIRQAAAELQLRNLNAIHARVEDLKLEPFDFITSRAFASLADFVSLTRKALGAGGFWVAMKGKVPTDEITDLPSDIGVFHVEHLTVPGLDAERCLVWLKPFSYVRDVSKG